MSTVEEIKKAIERLTLEERAELNAWLFNWEDDEWDKQMKQDAEAGRLDPLIRAADDDIRLGRTLKLP